MKYYKQIVNNEVTAYLSGSSSVKSDDLIEISEDEYTEAIQSLRTAIEEASVAEKSKDARIAELEKENAELKNELFSTKKALNT